ncbi:MAG: sugar ABC transporter ATP-binding protein, partial [Novosphingobium sp.]
MAILRAENIAKRYGGTHALRGVDFTVHAGAVNVLIGENGAGKSTLMRILAGIEQPTSGRLVMDGEPVAFATVDDAVARGIGIVHQELNLCPNLSIAENIFLARSVGKRGLFLDEAAERDRARALLARLDQDLDPATPVSALRIGQQQVVEIAKALAEDARILIMDEPTSALSASEVDALFRVIDELRRGGVAIVYISHRLEELLRIGDHITVLRDGRLVESAEIGAVSLPWIIERMLGDAGKIERIRPPATPGREVLAVHDVCLPAGEGGAGLDHVSATFHAGEITAIYGLLGSGRTELFEIVCGARAPASGSVVLDGVALNALTIAQRADKGLLLVPEDRQREGVFANLSVGGNIGLSILPRFARNGLISPAKEFSAVSAMIARL